MKKYTIIYSDCFHVGSHSHSIVKCDRVETDNIIELLHNTDKYHSGVNYVFDDWVVDATDWTNPK